VLKIAEKCSPCDIPCYKNAHMILLIIILPRNLLHGQIFSFNDQAAHNRKNENKKCQNIQCLKNAPTMKRYSLKL